MSGKKYRRRAVWAITGVLLIGLLFFGCRKRQAGNGGSDPPASQKSITVPVEYPDAVTRDTPENIEGVDRLDTSPQLPISVPADVTNVALGKEVTSSDDAPVLGDLDMITDGDKQANDYAQVELGPMLQFVTIDLEESHTLYAIAFWHYHRMPRVYFDVIVQVADDPDFIDGVQTLFNNDDDGSAGLGMGRDMHYIDTNKGKLVDARGVQGRYVRLYSRGNSSNDYNHYLEVEVYGKPAID